MIVALLQVRSWLPAIASQRDERGASLVEYALLLALIAIVCLVAVNTMGGPTSTGLTRGATGFGP